MSILAMTGHGTFDEDGERPSGRHAISEDAILTPIFHALNRGDGARGRRQDQAPGHTPDAVETFRRDPLAAPIPVQALEAELGHALRRTASDPAPHSWGPNGWAPSGPRRSRGRHHIRLESVAR